MPMYRQRGKEVFDIRGAEGRRMALAMKNDEASNPVAVGLFRPNTVMLDTNRFADTSSRERGGMAATEKLLSAV
jgi:hypothetical protein